LENGSTPRNRRKKMLDQATQRILRDEMAARIDEDSRCSCGSDLEQYELVDARGISCGMVCEKCEDEKKSHYRPEVFTNGNYECDEPIEPEDYY
jgi:hypothetical protein